MQKFADRSVALSVHVGNASVHPGKVSTSLRGGICIPCRVASEENPSATLPWGRIRASVLVGLIEVGGPPGVGICAGQREVICSATWENPLP